MTLRLGFSPFPYYITPDGLRPDLAPPLDEILRQIAAAGYAGVPAEVPAGTSPEDYAAMLATHGLAPAPGYFQADFAEADIAPVVEAARGIARQHRALGLDRIFVAQQFPDPVRIAAPTMGAGADPARLDQIVTGLSAVADAMYSEGVLPCLHQHVGTAIETEDEACFVLDAIASDRLLFGPDIGHLSWAGADPVGMLTRYRDRIGVVHLKDIRRAVADRGRAEGWGYRQTTWGGLWTVPGSGDIDCEAVLAVLRGLDIWAIAEIDIAGDDGPEIAARRSFEWLSARVAGEPATTVGAP
ncbi:inosose dehydratase [Novosphingobium sp. CF614]|uniref:sugar phosphate isomerase/epimerase family protein n=1 Tax=Novosphingobium sp. CF614 TaxID=1884364 RepID=UPI0008E4BF84|nr:sugar phosphate isomerase/epimerase [Novosphingobium sp. CF614]SFF91237.1 inosose dehydratase [Novosphingobium sp. CF614]